MSDETHSARDAVHAALPPLPGGEAKRPSWQEDERQWHATAIYARPKRRFDRRPVVEARGATEAEALRGLAKALGPDAA